MIKLHCTLVLLFEQSCSTILHYQRLEGRQSRGNLDLPQTRVSVAGTTGTIGNQKAECVY